MIKALFQRLMNSIANEPVVTVAGGIQAAVIWLFTYVASDWNPTEHAQQLAGMATAAAVAVSFAARQYVTPARKLAVAQKSSDGQAHVVTDVPAEPPAAAPVATGTGKEN